uniref:Vitellogenin n=1 Tax=Caenorhabditis japonica TaxID=281687 RepID=A0A8R1ELF4_CAEJA
MKFFIVLALLGATLATSHHSIERNIQETSFRTGREYRYLFNGQLSAGLPIPSTPQGITRLQTQVTLQLTNGNTVRMQLQKIRFAVSQEETNSMKMLPFEKFEEVDNMDTEHQQLLSMPVEFEYEHGLIGELRFTHGDQAWSENIKRAVVNMLQVNILKKEKHEGLEKSDNQEPTFSFTNVERTLEGECEVLYTVEESKKQEEQRWAKSINFDKCTRRPYIHHVQTPVCKDCKQTLEQDKMSSTVFNYNITGTPSNFLINSVELRSQHLFAPITEKHQLISAYTLNTLELIYAGEQKTEIKQVRSEQDSDLIYNQESEWAEQQTVEELKEQKYRQLVVLGEVNYGENTLKININGQQSPEQKKWVKQIEQAPEHETLLEAARLDQYQAVCEFDFEQKPAQYFNRYWSLVQAYLRSQYPWTSRIESREESSRKNVVRALFNIEPRQRQTVNMTIETPMETTALERFELPFQLPTAQIHYQPRNNRFEEKPFFEKMVRHASKQAKCAIKSTKIQTFDEVTYRNQFTPCYSVLAKDCGSEEKEPRFVVLMKKINEKKEWKNMKVLLGKQEIEMYMSEQGLVCLVNGEELEYQKDTQMDKKQFNLIWLNKNTIKFDSDDVTVQFDGVNARIHLSALYRNQQCGLCGHYDNEKETEFFDAENKENTIPKFAKSFLYQDSKCDYETEIFEKEDNFRRVEREQEQDEQEINYEESRREQDEPTEQVVVFEREHEICFTQKPVSRCENGKSQETKKQKTNVYCLPSSNSWARRQMREIRREPFTQWPEHKLSNLREQPQMEERVMRVAVDQKCEKYDY